MIDKQKFVLRVLDNVGTHTFATQINNIVMTVARNGNAYSVTYDTVN